MNITIYIAICSTFVLLIYFKFKITELEKSANILECELKNIEIENINLKNTIEELNSRFKSYRKIELARRSGLIID